MKKIRSKYTQPDFQFIRFRLGSREFGIDVSSVKEIMRLKASRKDEGAPAFISGLINVRSMTIPLIDMRQRFAFPPDITENSRVIIASVETFIIGLIVDEVSDIALGAKEVTLKPEHLGDVWDSCLEALVDTGNGKVLILEPSRLLTEEEKKALSCPPAGV